MTNVASKYDIEHRTLEPCSSCGVNVEMTNARWEVLGTYCDGCFGYPMCSCPSKHVGPCGETAPQGPVQEEHQ